MSLTTLESEVIAGTCASGGNVSKLVHASSTAEELTDARTEDLPPVSCSGVRCLTRPFQLELPSLSPSIYNLSQIHGSSVS